MCRWSIFYVIGTYCLVALYDFHSPIVGLNSPWRSALYDISMMVIGFFYLGIIFGSKFILFLYDYYEAKRNIR